MFVEGLRTPSPSMPAADYLETLVRCELVTREQLFSLSEEYGVDPARAPAKLIRLLVKEGVLTNWQSREVLRGRRRFFVQRYRLLDGLGDGLSGTVYKAVHTRLGHLAAVKVMHADEIDEERLARYLREMRIVASLDHPHIVKALDADADGTDYFLAMEYLQGATLEAWQKQNRQLPVIWSSRCCIQAALGLQHAHEHGLVHRDIHPRNLMVVDDEAVQPFVKILDFGLSRILDEADDPNRVTRERQVLGSLPCLAPEQAVRSRDADIRSDIFSLGCTLFCLLTGRYPFPQTRGFDNLVASRRRPLILRTYRPDAPPALARVVQKMIAFDAAARYQQPAEVAEALQAVLAEL